MHVKEIFISFRDRILIHGRLLSICFLIVIFVVGILNIPQLYSNSNIIISNSQIKAKDKLSDIQSDYSEKLKSKTYFIDLNGLFHRILGQREMNDTYKLENGKLTFALQQQDTSLFGANIVDLRNHLSAKGIPLMYIQAPFKISKYDPQLPMGVYDYSNQNADSLLEILKANDVVTLDLRDKIYEDGLDYYDCFFDVDLHWKPETGFWAAKVIMNELSQTYNCKINEDALDEKSYTVVTYKNWFLGGYGQRVGRFYAGSDDFSLFFPNFQTNIRMGIPSKSLLRAGEFGDVVYDMECVKEKGFYKKYPYSAFCFGDNPLTYFQNDNAPNNKKLLIVKDSFALSVVPYLSLQFAQIDMIDLRWYQDMTLKEYIAENTPDYVLILVDPYQFVDRLFTYG